MSEELRPTVETHFETSGSTDAIFGALAKAQFTYGPVLKKQSNPFFKSKYADLDAVIDAVKESLSKNEICFVQLPATTIAGAVAVELTTVLGHSSGQWIRCTLKMPVSKADAQGVGSAITYARRYALQAMVGVSAEEDDDGNAAVSGRMESKSKAKKADEPVERTLEPVLVNQAQIARLFAKAKANGWADDEIRELYGRWGYEHSREIMDRDYEGIIEEIEGRITDKLTKSVEIAKAKRQPRATADLELSQQDVETVFQK